MGIAVVGSGVDTLQLHNFDDVTVFKLTVKEVGVYAVFARVVIGNNDGDFQNATVRVTHGNGFDVIDQTDIRIPNNGSYSVSLQGTLRVVPNAPTVMELRCQTFNGFARQFSLFAVQVDALSFD